MAEEPHSPDTEKKSGGVNIGTIFGGIRNSVIAGRDVIINAFTGVEEQRVLRNRRIMLERVHDSWVKGVLEQSLHGAALIELGMEERPDAVEHPWDMVLRTERASRKLPVGTRIIDVFDEMGGSLLILGEPGAGKTTVLLELARDTIVRAQNDITQPIPVIFNLSSWTDRRRNLSSWLIDELHTKYGIPERIARPWIENDDLVLLLDGLDEVALEHRESCVQMLNSFHEEHLVTLVICSRIADYETMRTRLELGGAVFLQSLTPQQINDYLNGVDIELLAVRRTLQHDTVLQELVQTPLMLSIITLAYQGASIKELQPLDTIEARRKHVFDTYVQKMFERRGDDPSYLPKQTVHWLAWLAREMTRHSQSIFHLEWMQPDWLPRRQQRRMVIQGVAILNGLFFGLSFGLPIGLLFWVVSHFLGLLSGGVVNGMAFGLVACLVGWLLGYGKEIRPVETLQWSWSAMYTRLGRNLVYMLIFGIVGGVGGLIVGMTIGVIGVFFAQGIVGGLVILLLVGGVVVPGCGFVCSLVGERVGRRFSGMNSIRFGRIGGWVGGVIAGLAIVLIGSLVINTVGALVGWFFGGMLGLAIGVLGLAIGVSGGLVSLLTSGLVRGVITVRTRPNEGIRRSARRALAGGLLVGLVIALVFGLAGWLVGGLIDKVFTWDAQLATGIAFGLVFGPSGVLVGGLVNGGRAYLQHFILRIQLWLNHFAPLNYVRFLDYCVDRILLRRVGGGYIFIHRLLQEHFVAMGDKQDYE